MGFTSKRGRPRRNPDNSNIITKELSIKHKAGLTREPLDIFLAKGILSNIEHKAGGYLRKLYTLRFSIFHLKAYDHSYVKGRSLDNYDEEWLKIKNLEYQEAILILRSCKAFSVVTNLCLFNQFPRSFSYALKQPFNELKVIAEERYNEIEVLKYGLGKLAEFFGIIANIDYANQNSQA
ncbi:hypothetical protein NOVO_03425 [Rickettsiales bacterium Ac37b]|nr:hypothetical protein NOVO_03425 [Rickettsiales bacterium Ac37b]